MRFHSICCVSAAQFMPAQRSSSIANTLLNSAIVLNPEDFLKKLPTGPIIFNCEQTDQFLKKFLKKK
jgi:hypothetical protein